jgi:DnaJ-related protein SCJ1
MDPFGGMFGDIFSQFGFGNRGGGGHQEQTGPSARMRITLTLEDIYRGKEMEVTYTRQVLCPHCRGSGADNPEDVEVCS